MTIWVSSSRCCSTSFTGERVASRSAYSVCLAAKFRCQRRSLLVLPGQLFLLDRDRKLRLSYVRLQRLDLLLVGPTFLLALLFGNAAIAFQRIACVFVLLFQRTLVTLGVGQSFAKIHGTLFRSVPGNLFHIMQVMYPYGVLSARVQLPGNRIAGSACLVELRLQVRSDRLSIACCSAI